MAHEAYQNIAAQIPSSLARRLDARMDAERNGMTMGHVTRSDIIRAALLAFLADTVDPKDAPAERLKRRRVDPDAPGSRGHSRRPAPSPDLTRHPAIRTRTRRIETTDA
jgi:hypothetical protein